MTTLGASIGKGFFPVAVSLTGFATGSAGDGKNERQTSGSVSGVDALAGPNTTTASNTACAAAAASRQADK